MTFRSGHGKALLFLGLGVVYGAALAFMGFILAGAGHGNYLVLFSAASPLSLLMLWWFWCSVLSPPLMWGFVGWLLGSSSRFRQRIAVAVTLFHYASAVAYELFIEVGSPGDYVRHMFNYDRRSAVITTAIYFLGQILIWVSWFTGKSQAGRILVS